MRMYNVKITVSDWGGDEDCDENIFLSYFSDELSKVQGEVDKEIEKHRHDDLDYITSTISQIIPIEISQGLISLIGSDEVAKSKLVGQKYSWEIVKTSNNESSDFEVRM